MSPPRRKTTTTTTTTSPLAKTKRRAAATAVAAAATTDNNNISSSTTTTTSAATTNAAATDAIGRDCGGDDGVGGEDFGGGDDDVDPQQPTLVVAVEAQSNAARTIYTLRSARQLVRELHAAEATDDEQRRRLRSNGRVCRLRSNGLYLRREPRSDEKVRYAESEMRSIVRTVFFLHAFRTGPLESAEEIITRGAVTYEPDLTVRQDCSGPEFIDLLDQLLGPGFAAVCRLSVQVCFAEYDRVWRYSGLGRSFMLPGAADYVILWNFVNARATSYSPSMRFLLRNLTDHRTPQQGPIKELPPRLTRECRWGAARCDRGTVADRITFGGGGGGGVDANDTGPRIMASGS